MKETPAPISPEAWVEVLEKMPFIDFKMVPLEGLKAWLAFNQAYTDEYDSYNMGPEMMESLENHIRERETPKLTRWQKLRRFFK